MGINAGFGFRVLRLGFKGLEVPGSGFSGSVSLDSKPLNFEP
jgi:hypothetical protein